MKPSSTLRLTLIATFYALTAMSVLSGPGLACDRCECGGAPGCGEAPREGCDPCREACFATVESQTVEKKCWDVECKKVCVPKVVRPWGEGGSGLTCFDWLWSKKRACGCGESADCCEACRCATKPRCGRVICVRDLKAVTYECEEKVCKWEMRRLPACGDACCPRPPACSQCPDETEHPIKQPPAE